MDRRVPITPGASFFGRNPQSWDPFKDMQAGRFFAGTDYQPMSPLSPLDYEMQRQRFFQDPMYNIRQHQQQPFGTPVTSFPSAAPHFFSRQLSDGTAQVNTQNGTFSITIEMQNFAPEEIQVKTVGSYVEISGCHEEKKEGEGTVSRKYSRKYNIPENVDPLTITSTFSPEGVLTVSAPVKVEAPKQLEVQHEKPKELKFEKVTK